MRTELAHVKHRLPVLRLIGDDSLLQQMLAVHDAIARRAFDLFQLNGCRPGTALDDWLKAESEMLMPTPVEVTETDKEVTISASVPGFTEEELDVHLDANKLILTAKHEKSEEEKKANVVYSEYKKDEIARRVDLPVPVDPDKSTATLHNGIVKITVAKAAPAVPGKKVPVSAAAA